MNWVGWDAGLAGLEPMEFEIMEAGARPGRPGQRNPGQTTFSVGIRPVRASGHKAAAWVRIVGRVQDELRVDAEVTACLAILNGGRKDLPTGSAPRGVHYRITAAGKAGGLRRAT